MVVQAGRSKGSPRASTPDAGGESFEAGLSPLARAVPRTRPTGDLGQDTNNQVRMMTFQKIIMRLEANPDDKPTPEEVKQMFANARANVVSKKVN